jgi:hypothetical protein
MRLVGGEDVAEQMSVRSENRGLRDATLDHEFGSQICHAISLPTSTAHHMDEPARSDEACNRIDGIELKPPPCGRYEPG